MQPYIRGGILEFFASTVEQLGGSTEALLEEADVAPEVLKVPGLFLPYASYMRLLDAAARATNTPHFGLLMARYGTAETLGTIGIIMSQAETVGSAWETLTQYYRIHDTYGRVRLYRYPDTAMISYGLPGRGQPGSRQVHDVAVEITCNIMRRFCGPDFQAARISFPYPEPGDLTPYRDLPAQQLDFDASVMEMHVAADTLAMPLRGRDDDLRVALDQMLSARAGRETSATALVEERVRTMLSTGDCTLERVAGTLAVSPRTLQARLETEQSSFRTLLEQVRREIATHHLRRGDMQLTQLAQVLGYSELSAFSRSFKGWFGVSPRQWQARLHA